MSKSKWRVLLLCFPLLAGAHCAERNDPDVQAGKRAYAAGDYDLSVSDFQQALGGDGERAPLHFDLGTAIVQRSMSHTSASARQEDLDLAIVSFHTASAQADPALQEKAQYNLGNALVLRGRFAEAVAAYRRVLIQNPENQDARHNMELALLARHALEQDDQELSLALAKAIGFQGAQDESEPGEGAPPVAGVLATENPDDEGAATAGSTGTDSEDAGESGQGEAGADTQPATGEPPSEDGVVSDAEASSEPGEPADSASSPDPQSTSTLSLRKKLQALERRSAELRRASLLRQTTRRVRDPKKMGRNQ